MNIARFNVSSSIRTLLALAAAAASSSAFAAGSAASAEANARYQQEKAVCLSGQSNQDRATCLREAGAALALAQSGQKVQDDASATLARNATKRCDGLPDPDRQACMARMQGKGSTSGSVAGGGIYRELVTPDVAAPAASAMPAR